MLGGSTVAADLAASGFAAKVALSATVSMNTNIAYQTVTKGYENLDAQEVAIEGLTGYVDCITGAVTAKLIKPMKTTLGKALTSFFINFATDVAIDAGIQYVEDNEVDWGRAIVSGAANAGLSMIDGFTSGEFDVEPTKEPISYTYEEKIGNQMEKRGWTDESIDATINNPSRTVDTRDYRHMESGLKMDDPATIYYAADGSYVVRNNITGDIVQISDKFDFKWIDPLGKPRR